MPSLAESLDALAHHSEQIAYLSTLNASPPGPFTTAYLHLPPPHLSHLGKGNVLELIRDASDAERRLFKFVGENNLPGAAGGGGNKRVEKREGGVVTPLKELKRGGGDGEAEKDEVEVMLRTALKLVEDYRPMPRARAHVINLLDQHHRNLDRLAELEMLIAEASKPVDTPASPPPQSEKKEGPQQEPVKLTPEEAIKAEESALRALEAKIIPLRRVSQPSQDEQLLDPQDMVPPVGRNIPQSPPPSHPQYQFEPQPTPSQAQSAQPRTPGRSMPHVTNSLVNATPRHAIERLERAERIDRFSPLKLITPRAPGTLRGEGTIFGRRMGSSSASSSKLGAGLRTSMSDKRASDEAGETSHNPAPAIADAPSTPFEAAPDPSPAGEDPDETMRLTRVSPSTASPIKTAAAGSKLPAPPSPPKKVHLPVEGLLQSVPDIDVLAQTPQICADGELDGVDTDAEAVKTGVEKIWSNVGDIMRQGLESGVTVEKDTISSVRHLIHLSKSNLPPPPSPSTSSSLSSFSHGGLPPPKPITSETILFAHLFLSILRVSSNSDGSPGEMDMNEIKESLGNVAKEKGWDGAGGLGTKVIYAAVGKRVVKIERKGGGAGRVRFAD
ncbi:hypothetical protein I308_104265 [Cryptococcus tetragattii IND107]|uniref:Uncharacterized protein n=1 Tax=Cryptococcus tetragattii IND107 TaxID=1296105 RepID=A0ABR3BPW6_9TREE|nr:hypothetical protein I308_00854 [Cryptococcus tetragattii IND107]